MLLRVPQKEAMVELGPDPAPPLPVLGSGRVERVKMNRLLRRLRQQASAFSVDVTV